MCCVGIHGTEPAWYERMCPHRDHFSYFFCPSNYLRTLHLELTVNVQLEDVPFTTQTRLHFDVILPLWGRRGPR